MAVNLERSNYTYKVPFERISVYAAEVLSKYENPSEVKALDLGFGGGRHLKLLKDLGYDVYGIDVTEDALDTTYYNLGENFIPRERLTIGNILEQPIYPEESFDVVLSVGVIWSLGYEKLSEFMDKIGKILKKDGYLIANFRTKFDDIYLAANPGGKGEKKEAYFPEQNKYLAFLDMDELKELVECYGFSIERLERYDWYCNRGGYDSYYKEGNSYWCTILRKK